MFIVLLSLAHASVVTWYADADGDGHGNPGAALVDSDAAILPGFVRSGLDCDDSDPNAFPGALETCDGTDEDCDGVVDQGACSCPDVVYEEATYLFCTNNVDWFTAQADCDGLGYALNTPDTTYENDWVWATAVTYANRTWWLGGNDLASEGTWTWTDGTPWGSVIDWASGEPNNAGDEDCLETNRFSTTEWNDAPCSNGNPYVCEAPPDPRWWYPDGDGDGFGVLTGAILAVAQPADTVLDSSDCDDLNPAVFPGAIEVCNGVDDDCSGQIDDYAASPGTWYVDQDGDGFGDPNQSVSSCTQPPGTVASGDDCDDTSALVYPGGLEVCDGLDNDCNGLVDDNALNPPQWYADLDGDGFGDPTNAITSCSQLPGTVGNALDCDDTLATVNPGAPEVPANGIDDDCDGVIDGGTSTTGQTGSTPSTGTGSTSSTTPTDTDTASPVDTGTTSSDTGPSGAVGTDTGKQPSAGEDREYDAVSDATANPSSYTCGCQSADPNPWWGWLLLVCLGARRKS